MSDHKLSLWTIYWNPSDHPGRYVVRRFELDQPTAEAFVCLGLAQARALIPPGLYRQERDPNDDPVIVETWF